jgi:hypothetical protein
MFDEDLCCEIQEKIDNKMAAQMMVLTFRRAIGLPIKESEENKLLK